MNLLFEIDNNERMSNDYWITRFLDSCSAFKTGIVLDTGLSVGFF